MTLDGSNPPIANFQFCLNNLVLSPHRNFKWMFINLIQPQ